MLVMLLGVDVCIREGGDGGGAVGTWENVG